MKTSVNFKNNMKYQRVLEKFFPSIKIKSLKTLNYYAIVLKNVKILLSRKLYYQEKTVGGGVFEKHHDD